MVNIVVCLEFLAKAKPLRPRPAYCKAKATKLGLKATKFGLKATKFGLKAKD